MSRPFVGIDTARLRGSVEKPQDLDAFSSVGLRRVGDVHVAKTVTSGRDTPHFRVNLARQPPEVVFELSIPNWLQGNNLVAASVDDTMEAVGCAMDRSSRVLRWIDDPHDLRVVRLDLVRDFVASDPSRSSASSRASPVWSCPIDLQCRCGPSTALIRTSAEGKERPCRNSAVRQGSRGCVLARPESSRTEP